MQEMGVLKKLGIKGRVLLLTLLPTSLMALVLGGYFTWMQQSDLQTQLMQRGEMIAEQLAPLVAPAMGHGNTDLLERIATQSLEQPDVRAVTFLAPDRTRWPTPARPCSTSPQWRQCTTAAAQRQ
jgi:two-component system sensor histidine kinase BarA